MAHIQLRDLTAEQRRIAIEMAKRAAGVAGIPDDKLTPMALFLMSAVANECCSKAALQSPLIVTPPESESAEPFSGEGL